MRTSVGRRLLGALVAAALLAGAGLIAWRVLRPAEVRYPASAPYPASAAEARPGVTARFSGASLIVDGRLRVYANQRSLRADTPVDATTQRTPVWSYRRWPEQLTGVVAVGPIVVSRWSDGEVIALDARSGKIVWRVAGPPGPAEYGGRRTGARTVWQPPGLYTAGDTVVVGGNGLLAVGAFTGWQLWSADVPCPDGFTTSGGLIVCGGIATNATTGRAVHWAPGPAEPLGCAAARSACAGVRGSDGRGWLTAAATPVRAAALDAAGATAVGELVVVPTGTGFVAAAGTVERWRWTSADGAAARVLAVQPGRVHLLTDDRRLVTLDAATGAVRSAFTYTFGTERPTWTPGLVYAAHGFVAVERLAPSPDVAAGDGAYYFTSQTVLLAGT